jgi:hypothetical protein
MGKHRPHSVICKERQLKLEAKIRKQELTHEEDMREVWVKLRRMKNIQSAQSTEIGKTQKHLKGRDLWTVGGDCACVTRMRGGGTINTDICALHSNPILTHYEKRN